MPSGAKSLSSPEFKLVVTCLSTPSSSLRAVVIVTWYLLLLLLLKSAAAAAMDTTTPLIGNPPPSTTLSEEPKHACCCCTTTLGNLSFVFTVSGLDAAEEEEDAAACLTSPTATIFPPIVPAHSHQQTDVCELLQLKGLLQERLISRPTASQLLLQFTNPDHLILRAKEEEEEFMDADHHHPARSSAAPLRHQSFFLA
jgi:hypothetical protein